MREISKTQVELLKKHHVIRNTIRGLVDYRNGYTVGFYRTKNKRYIEDKYVAIAETLANRKDTYVKEKTQR